MIKASRTLDYYWRDGDKLRTAVKRAKTILRKKQLIQLISWRESITKKLEEGEKYITKFSEKLERSKTYLGTAKATTNLIEEIRRTQFKRRLIIGSLLVKKFHIVTQILKCDLEECKILTRKILGEVLIAKINEQKHHGRIKRETSRDPETPNQISQGNLGQTATDQEIISPTY